MLNSSSDSGDSEDELITTRPSDSSGMQSFEVETSSASRKRCHPQKKCAVQRCVLIMFIILLIISLIIVITMAAKGLFTTRYQLTPVTCSEGEIRCDNQLECLSSKKWCDGVEHCSDRSDEWHCGECHLGDVWYYECDNGDCIKREWVCDHESDCPRAEEEKNCNKCNSTQFTCYNYECVDLIKRCDGYYDCTDFTDELNCFEVTDGTVNYHYQNSILPVCYSNTLHNMSADICAQLGKSIFNSVLKKRQLTIPINSVYLKREDNYTDVKIERTCRTTVQAVCEECGKSSFIPGQAALIGGEPTNEISEFPWHVKILIDKELCGGSIISTNWILTAAHCVSGAAVNSVKVTYGTVYFDGHGGIEISAEQIYTHPKYAATHYGQHYTAYNYDVALIKIPSIRSSSSAQPVCLPSYSDIPAETTTCYITGFGDITKHPYHNYYPERLQKGKTRVWKKEKFLHWYGKNGVANVTGDDVLTAGYRTAGVDSCAGDSGSALVCYVNSRWVQLGAVSWGLSCVAIMPSMYANISYVMPWIIETVHAHGGAIHNEISFIILIISLFLLFCDK